MKKGIALWLAVCLLFSCTAAMAAAPITDYTLKEKWDLQMQGSGFKGQVAFTVEGDAAFGMDESLWQTLKMLLPKLETNVQSMPRSGNRDTLVTFSLNGETAGTVKVLSDDAQTVIKSDILGEDEYYYQYSSQFDLVRLFSGDEDKWPDLKNTLVRILMADDAWKEQAEPFFSVYTSRLALWMQEYMQVTGENTENGYQTHMSCHIPAEDVKVQVKRMLSMLYQDEDMLQLLSQVLTAQERDTYLNRSNQDIFFIMLDLLPMDGDVVIERVYDEMGQALLDKITLPFASVSPWQQMGFTVTNQRGVKAQTFKGVYRDGREAEIMLREAEEGTVTGTVRMDLKAEEGEKGGVRAFTFNYAWEAGEETYDLDLDKCEHLSDLTVLIKPMQEDTTGMKETTLSVRMSMTSKSSRRAATYITVDAALTDQETGSVLGMQLSCNTASPWTPDTLATLNADTTVLDEMTDEEVRELGELLTMNVEGWLGRLMMQLMPVSMEE